MTLWKFQSLGVISLETPQRGGGEMKKGMLSLSCPRTHLPPSPGVFSEAANETTPDMKVLGKAHIQKELTAAWEGPLWKVT